MLELLRTDDKVFSEIFDDALQKLPELSPQWTDYNTHDPGITFLEMLSWLTEMQRYHLSQITEKHQRKYLKLLGVSPKQASPAHLMAVLKSEEEMRLLRGSKAYIGGIPFTLCKEMMLGNIEIGIKRTPYGKISPAYGFMPFGAHPQRGNCFYFSFSSYLPAYELYIQLSECKRNPIDENVYPLSAMEFDVLCKKEWLPCDCVDKTFGMMQSGSITISLPWKMRGKVLIRCTATRCEADIPPMLEWVSLQAAELLQFEEIAQICEGEDTYLSQFGYPVASLVRNGDGYVRAVKSPDITIFSDTPYRNLIFEYDGAPILLETAPRIIVSENFELMVEEEDGLFRYWHKTEDLSCSGADDRHYMLDAENGLLYFGDGRNGRCPGKNIIIASMQLTMGAGGNVKEKCEFEVECGEARAKACNPNHSYNGYDAEAVEEAFNRAANERRTPYRAICREDYLTLVKQTPGLCVESVNVYYEEEKVCVCVKPRYGVLSEAYIRNIRRLLYDRKLPCTEIRIVPPEICEGELFVQIVPKKWAIDKKIEIRQFAEEYFANQGTIFGLTISMSKWRRIFRELPFVKEVREIALRWRSGKTLSSDAEFTLPPNGLLGISKMKIEFV